MKSKMLVICSSVALLHVFAGAMIFMGGCSSVEEEPMPDGAYQPPVRSQAHTQDPGSQYILTPTVAGNRVRPQQPQQDPEFITPSGNLPAYEPVSVGPAFRDPVAEIPPVPGKSEYYTVRKGDSLWKVAHKFGVSIDELTSYNQLKRNQGLRVGQKLLIPFGKKASGKPVRQAKVNHSTKMKPVKAGSSFTPSPADGKYTVQRGDSFYKIAVKFGVKAEAIAEANKMTLSKPLKVGQTLVIPAKLATKKGKTDKNVKKTVKTKKDVKKVAPKKDAKTDKKKAAELPEPPKDKGTLPVEPVPNTNSEKAPLPPSADVAPIATQAAVDAVVEPALPDVKTAAPAAGGSYKAEVDADTTVEAVATNYGCLVSDLKKLNPNIPADGKIKAGTILNLP